MKYFFAKEALKDIPKILTLLDRNQHSSTYGCFDRNYWHYKIIDFPSGMAQELVLPLALVYSLDIPGNEFYKQEVLRKWIFAGVEFAANESHQDGSCDDYFPFEKAGGATAFSLLACLYSYKIMGFDNSNLELFFQKRSDWLSKHHESGQLTNHQCLIALCLMLASEVLNTDRWHSDIEDRIDKVLGWQNSEGWFPEYEGCDLGYLTLSISLLSWIYSLKPSSKILNALKKSIKFASVFVHPDGSFGGEYSSRNTYNFFPHGFEIMGKEVPEATAVNDKYLLGMQRKLTPCYSDDHIIGHHTWSFLLAWRDFSETRSDNILLSEASKSSRLWFPNARLLIDKRGKKTLYLSLSKGGVFKLYEKDTLIASDTQFSVKMKDGKNAVGHMIGGNTFTITEDSITIRGNLGWAKSKKMSTLNLILLRLIMLFGGRLFPNLIRSILQKVLIVGKKESKLTFERKLCWVSDGDLVVNDALHSDNWRNVASVKIGVDQTPIYVVMSRVYQPGQLNDWIDLPLNINKFDNNIRIKRFF